MNFNKFIIPIIIILLLGIVTIIIFTQNVLTIKHDREKVEVNIFFGNTLKNPQAEDCKAVFPVAREIIKSDKIIEVTLEELLKGLTQEEKAQGYISGINQGVRVQKISTEQGILRVDFNSKLEEGIGGSCLVSMIRSQILETLKQFPNVNDVIISINDRIEDILQP